MRTLAVPAIRVVVGLATGDNSTDTVDEGVEDLGAGSRQPKVRVLGALGVAVPVPVENLGTRSGQPKVRVLRARVSPSRYQSNN